MKRLMLLTLALALLTTTALAESERTILLYTDYEQLGWGDALQVGWVDSEGEMWFWEGHAGETDWPDARDKKTAWMLSRTDAESLGRLSDEALANLKGLTLSLPDGKPTWQAAACDAGTPSRPPVYSKNGMTVHTTARPSPTSSVCGCSSTFCVQCAALNGAVANAANTNV